MIDANSTTATASTLKIPHFRSATARQFVQDARMMVQLTMTFPLSLSS